MTEENRERTREMIKVMQSYLDGEVVEIYFNGTWTKVNSTYCWASGFNYRIAGATTPDTINWDHVAPDFKWMARDKDSSVYVYEEVPVLTRCLWDSGSGCFESAMALSSYKRGTCDWEDSLVERPK